MIPAAVADSWLFWLAIIGGPAVVYLLPTVIAVARRVERLEMAARMGANECVLNGSGHDAVARIKELTGGYGADVVIEAVGKPETWELAVHMLRRGGTVNFFGGCPSDTRVSLDTGLLHYSELKCLASFHHTPAVIRKALDIVVRGEISARELSLIHI